MSTTTDFASPEYLVLLRQFEGFKPYPYVCPAGKCTIGYGTNLEAHPRFIPFDGVRALVTEGSLRGTPLVTVLHEWCMTWTTDQAEAAMREELHDVHEALLKRCQTYAMLLQRGERVRAEALLDMAYNMGVGQAPGKGRKGCGLLGFHQTLPMIQRGEYAAAAENLTKSAWYRQVGRRARAVCHAIREGVWPTMAENARGDYAKAR